MRRSIWLVPLLSLALLLGSGCGKEENVVLIGLQAPITGEYAYEGEGFRNAVQLIVDQVNAEGGLPGGARLRLEVGDDMGKPDEASRVAQQLVSKGVKFVIGSYSSTCTEPASAIYDENGVLQITPSSTATRLSRKGYKRFFRVCFLDSRQGEYMARFAVERLGAKRVAVLHDNSTYAKGLAEVVRDHVDQLGAETVFFDALNPEDRDFSPVLTNIRGQNPDVLVFTGYHPQGGLLLKQARSLGCAFPFLAGNACNNPELVEIAGKEAAAGAYFVTEPLPSDLDYPEAQEFARDYEARYGAPPTSVWWAMAADACKVICAGIKAVGKADPDAVARYLHTEFKDFPGITGPIQGFDENGDRLGTVYLTYQVQDDGTFKPLKGA
jgi:branched-chain amino acid transport system substrate-binding protein